MSTRRIHKVWLRIIASMVVIGLIHSPGIDAGGRNGDKRQKTVWAVVNEDPYLDIYLNEIFPENVTATLSGVPMQCYRHSERLECLIPEDSLPGNYTLELFKEKRRDKKSLIAAALITIGAVGPQGPPGDPAAFPAGLLDKINCVHCELAGLQRYFRGQSALHALPVVRSVQP